MNISQLNDNEKYLFASIHNTILPKRKKTLTQKVFHLQKNQNLNP